MTLTPAELERLVRTSVQLTVLFVCPTCDRAHHPTDLGVTFQCRSCEHGLPTPARPRCPDCRDVRPRADDALWFPVPGGTATP